MSIVFEPGEDFRFDFPTVDVDGDNVTLSAVEFTLTLVQALTPFAIFENGDSEVSISSGKVQLDIPASSTAAYESGIVCMQMTGTTANGDVDIACYQFRIRECC